MIICVKGAKTRLHFPVHTFKIMCSLLATDTKHFRIAVKKNVSPHNLSKSLDLFKSVSCHRLWFSQSLFFNFYFWGWSVQFPGFLIIPAKLYKTPKLLVNLSSQRWTLTSLNKYRYLYFTWVFPASLTSTPLHVWRQILYFGLSVAHLLINWFYQLSV